MGRQKIASDSDIEKYFQPTKLVNQNLKCDIQLYTILKAFTREAACEEDEDDVF